MATDSNKPQNDKSENFGLPVEDFTPLQSTPNKRWVKVTILIASVALLAGSFLVFWLLQQQSDSISYLKNQLTNSTEEVITANETDPPTLEFNLQKQEISIEDQSQGIAMIEKPTGLYYVVMCSYIDIDLAKDYGKKLIEKGLKVQLILPAKGKNFIRLTVGALPTHAEATMLATELKPTYGEGIWVLKY